MTHQLTDLYTALFNALETLDQQLDGYGLYAIREHQKTGDILHPPLVSEWEAAIRPTLHQFGHTVGGRPKAGTFVVTLPEQGAWG